MKGEGLFAFIFCSYCFPEAPSWPLGDTECWSGTAVLIGYLGMEPPYTEVHYLTELEETENAGGPLGIWGLLEPLGDA